MGTTRLPPDFKEFLQLLNSHQIDYLIIGGYAVGFYGYPRATGDLDLWVAIDPATAYKLVAAIEAFGFRTPDLSPEVFLTANQVIRMGVPPLRIEILTTISGVRFEDCFAARTVSVLDEIPVNVINLTHLKLNKKASGRLKDLDDLEHLP